jgi:hypothetical protein
MNENGILCLLISYVLKMYKHDMNATLLQNWNGETRDFDVKSDSLWHLDTTGYVFNPYFFLTSELDVITPRQYRIARQNGGIRHCTVHNHKFYDYIVHKYFDTIHDWAEDAGGTIEKVLYGTNRVIRGERPKYVMLHVLLAKLGYPQETRDDTFTSILAKLGISVDKKQSKRCLVQDENSTITIARLTNCSYNEFVLVLPGPNMTPVTRYSKLSDMPTGTKVFLHSTGCQFESLDVLLSNV